AVVSLKRNIDRATAERIYQRLSDAGAVANIVPTVSGSASKEADSKEADSKEQNNEQDTKSFSLAPLGSTVLDAEESAEEKPSSVVLDHLSLEPIGSNIVEEEEQEAIEPVAVDTSHLSLE
ncbi:MAG: hypothetical protein P8H31_00540, partial [Porticoccaceae bacterium]|nr:hypothetical protein [Porticoccaceae bacterium]